MIAGDIFFSGTADSVNIWYHTQEKKHLDKQMSLLQNKLPEHGKAINRYSYWNHEQRKIILHFILFLFSIDDGSLMHETHEMKQHTTKYRSPD